VPPAELPPVWTPGTKGATLVKFQCAIGSSSICLLSMAIDRSAQACHRLPLALR
jgi:hypothetical protein